MYQSTHTLSLLQNTHTQWGLQKTVILCLAQRFINCFHIYYLIWLSLGRYAHFSEGGEIRMGYSQNENLDFQFSTHKPHIHNRYFSISISQVGKSSLIRRHSGLCKLVTRLERPLDTFLFTFYHLRSLNSHHHRQRRYRRVMPSRRKL